MKHKKMQKKSPDDADSPDHVTEDHDEDEDPDVTDHQGSPGGQNEQHLASYPNLDSSRNSSQFSPRLPQESHMTGMARSRDDNECEEIDVVSDEDGTPSRHISPNIHWIGHSIF